MMEREFAGVTVHHEVPEAELETVMKHVCRYYRIRPPRFCVYNDPNDKTFGESVSDMVDGARTNPKIRLNRGFHGANLMTLLHELAHYIADYTWPGHEGHTPKFVAIYMHLLDKYRVIPSDAFRLVAKRRNVKIAGRFKPGAIRG